MSYISKFAVLGASALGSMLLIAAPAQAQATRTWVSGVGDDANPCSRTAPCKTFAGAISKTAAGGEINCIDPGAFGTVTITKTMTIQCDDVQAGVLASGTTGIIVNAGANDVVIISGLDIEGGLTGINGIRFLAGAALHVRNTTINGFQGANANGILFASSSAASALYLNNISVTRSGSGTGGAVVVQPNGASVARVEINGIQVNNNPVPGLRIDGSAATAGGMLFGNVQNSQFSGNTDGISLLGNSTPVRVQLKDSSITNNSGTAIASNSTQVVMTVSNTAIMLNNLAITRPAGGSIISFGDNLMTLNSSGDGNGFSAVIGKN